MPPISRKKYRSGKRQKKWVNDNNGNLLRSVQINWCYSIETNNFIRKRKSMQEREKRRLYLYCMHIRKILKQPFPAYQPSWNILKSTGYAGTCVFAVLFLLKPFGLDTLSTQQLFWNALSFGLVTFVLASFNAMVLPFLFPRMFEEKGWTAGKEMLMMLWQLTAITAGNIILAHFLYHAILSLRSALAYLWITLVVGIFPIGLTILLKQKMFLKRYVDEAEKIDEQLNDHDTDSVHRGDRAPQSVTFYSENGKEYFTVGIADIRYITSADNYIRIHYMGKGIYNPRLLRGSLRKAEETLAGIPVFFRCHRTCIVNLTAVTHVSGNAQGYKLHLSGTDDIIPVSRNLNTIVKEKLLALQASPQ